LGPRERAKLEAVEARGSERRCRLPAAGMHTRFRRPSDHRHHRSVDQDGLLLHFAGALREL